MPLPCQHPDARPRSPSCRLSGTRARPGPPANIHRGLRETLQEGGRGYKSSPEGVCYRGRGAGAPQLAMEKMGVRRPNRRHGQQSEETTLLVVARASGADGGSSLPRVHPTKD